MFRYEDNISGEKKELFVLIFGPYQNSSLKKLERIRNHLRKNEYEKTFLVKDLKDPDGLSKTDDEEYWYKRSMYWLQQSHVNLFILLKNNSLDSVIVEIIEAVNNLSSLKCTTFFLEDGVSLGSLVKGALKNFRCNISTFSNTRELNQKILSVCWNHLIEDNCKSS